MGLDRGLLMQMARAEKDGPEAICEQADDCLKLERHDPTCPHRKIHKHKPLCDSGRCSIGRNVKCIPPTDGQRVMEKMLEMQKEAEPVQYKVQRAAMTFDFVGENDAK